MKISEVRLAPRVANRSILQDPELTAYKASRCGATLIASSPSSTMTSDSERLKGEGNALFAKDDFTGAYEKYTEALKHDDKNAVLYCNRAACCLRLNRYD